MPEVTLHTLEGLDAQRYGHFTFPAYRHLLDGRPQPRHREGDDRFIQPFAIGVHCEGEPIGLALAEHAPGRRIGTILSVFIATEWRRLGLATRLLQVMEDVARREGLHGLETTWMHGGAQGEVIPGLLARCGFASPQSRMLSVRFHAERMAEAEWLARYPFRTGYEVLSWAEIGEAEIASLQQAQARGSWIAPDLQPWDHARFGFEPHTSLALRYHGTLVAWIITHAIGEGIVRYTCSFIRPDLGRLGRILPLYGASFQRLRAAGFREGMFTTPMHHVGMAAFAKRWMAPYCHFVGETRGARKEWLDA